MSVTGKYTQETNFYEVLLLGKFYWDALRNAFYSLNRPDNFLWNRYSTLCKYIHIQEHNYIPLCAHYIYFTVSKILFTLQL